MSGMGDLISASLYVTMFKPYADMAELADALDLGVVTSVND